MAQIKNSIKFTNAILNTESGEIIEIPKKKDAEIKVYKIEDILRRFESTQEDPRFVSISIDETNEIPSEEE